MSVITEVKNLMQKKFSFVVAGLLLAGSVFAYNPPAGGQNLHRLSSPTSLTGAGSAAGGALYEVLPAAIFNNPALPAFEQRIVLSVGASLLVDGNSGTDREMYKYTDSDGECLYDTDDFNKAGEALEVGLLVPSRYGVATAMFQGVWAPLADMPIGDFLLFSGNVSKDITDQVSIGVTGTLGAFGLGKFGSDFSATVGLGIYYDYGELKFLKDLRFGFALLNLGKTFTKTELPGINASEYAENWPGIVTPRIGGAATLLETKKLRLGTSIDMSAPTFQDFVFDAGLQVEYAQFLKLATAWEYDTRECNWNCKNLLPSVGLSFKFVFHSKEDSTITKFAGGQESEMTVSGAWHQMYEDVNVVSASTVLKLGLIDKDPPVITLWDEE